jgi:hypothetical protein
MRMSVQAECQEPCRGKGNCSHRDTHLDDGIEVGELGQVIPLDRPRVRVGGGGLQAMLCQLNCHLGFHLRVLRQQVQRPGQGVPRCLESCERVCQSLIIYIHGYVFP